VDGKQHEQLPFYIILCNSPAFDTPALYDSVKGSDRDNSMEETLRTKPIYSRFSTLDKTCFLGLDTWY